MKIWIIKIKLFFLLLRLRIFSKIVPIEIIISYLISFCIYFYNMNFEQLAQFLTDLSEIDLSELQEVFTPTRLEMNTNPSLNPAPDNGTSVNISGNSEGNSAANIGNSTGANTGVANAASTVGNTVGSAAPVTSVPEVIDTRLVRHRDTYSLMSLNDPTGQNLMRNIRGGHLELETVTWRVSRDPVVSHRGINLGTVGPILQGSVGPADRPFSIRGIWVDIDFGNAEVRTIGFPAERNDQGQTFVALTKGKSGTNR